MPSTFAPGRERPGAWWQITPATVTADPISGSFPTGYLIANAADGALKHRAESLSWAIQVESGTSSKLGFHGASQVGQQAVADQAVATDLTSEFVLANDLQAALVEKVSIKSSP